MRYSASIFGDFKCGHCGAWVSSAQLLSGGHNRNHCPYCLWSCHLDLYASGDRLSACKGRMQPIGLTLKLGRNKYRRDAGGELMLVHQCVDCGSLSINRIAADDDPATLLAVFEASIDRRLHAACESQGIRPLRESDREVLRKQLYGVETLTPAW